MKTGFTFEKIWEDIHAQELNIHAFNTTSTFTNQVYIGHETIGEVIEGLTQFNQLIEGPNYYLDPGGFGATDQGGFHARFEHIDNGKICVKLNLESGNPISFKINYFDKATLYFTTQPVLIDNFISELKSLNLAVTDQAKLEGI